MARKRKAPNLTQKLGAALIEIDQLRAQLSGEPRVDLRDWSKMTARQIGSLWQWHHVTYHSWLDDDADKNHPVLLFPLMIRPHRERTAKVDIPTIAKIKRGIKKRQATKAAKPQRKARAISGSKGTPWRRKMSGEVVPRAGAVL